MGPKGYVYAFEPREQFYSVLCRNVALNKYSNIKSHNVGLGQEDKTIFVPAIDLSGSSNLGGTSLLETDRMETASSEAIQISTIDSFAFSKVDFMKIDVEGMESQVLMGAYDTIRRCGPVIFLEVNSLEGGVPVLEFSKHNDYRSYLCLTTAYNKNNFRNEKGVTIQCNSLI